MREAHAARAAGPGADSAVVDAIVGRFVAHDHFSPCAESQAPLLFAIERDIHGRKPVMLPVTMPSIP